MIDQSNNPAPSGAGAPNLKLPKQPEMIRITVHGGQVWLIARPEGDRELLRAVSDRIISGTAQDNSADGMHMLLTGVPNSTLNGSNGNVHVRRHGAEQIEIVAYPDMRELLGKAAVCLTGTDAPQLQERAGLCVFEGMLRKTSTASDAEPAKLPEVPQASGPQVSPNPVGMKIKITTRGITGVVKVTCKSEADLKKVFSLFVDSRPTEQGKRSLNFEAGGNLSPAFSRTTKGITDPDQRGIQTLIVERLSSFSAFGQDVNLVRAVAEAGCKGGKALVVEVTYGDGSKQFIASGKKK